MKIGWKVKLGFGLVALSAEVLFVTLILHSFLERREREEMMHKLNMVIGAFFSEVGAEVLKRVAAMDQVVEVREHLIFTAKWDAARYEAAKKAVAAYDYDVQPTPSELRELRDFMVSKRQFLLGLLQNPNLLEHET